MRRWFLSYHSPDEALAERLKRSIEAKDPGARVFFAPQHLRAGFWSRALAREIAEADVFVLLVGAKGVGDWQVMEYDEALDRKVTSPAFQLAVVLLEGQEAPGLAFLRRLQWIVSADPASDRDVARLIAAVSGGGEGAEALWRYTAPYRGLAAMEEKDSDYFFGRGRETVEVLQALASSGDRLPVLLGNSGVGKSSLARAGVLAALKRQAWPEEVGAGPDAPGAWPHAFAESRRWCFLALKPGGEPLRALVAAFLDTWQYEATDPKRVERLNDWVKLLDEGNAALRDLIEATDRRYRELDRESPPAFLLYVDQGEELYVRAQERGRRFSELLADAVADPRLLALMSLRADFLGELQKDEPLHRVHLKIDVPPLREAQLREVVGRPADLLSARFEPGDLPAIITRRTAEDSAKDAGALPLLSYTLDDMWKQMVKRGDGVLRLAAASFEPGGVLVDRADRFLATHAGAEEALRRVLTLKLATVREGEEPTRRRAPRSEFTDEEWRLVSELANDPNRLLVVAAPPGGEAYAEVAHEAIFRRWRKLVDWIAAEREFLAWRTGLEAARRAWQATPEASKAEALLMGAALAQAQAWFATRRGDLSRIDREFVDRSLARETRRRSRARRGQVILVASLVGIILGLVGWMNQSIIEREVHWWTTMRPYRVANFDPYVRTREQERALKPRDSFRECAKFCPEMVVVPAGSFTMGSPDGEKGRAEDNREGPRQEITIGQPFAVGKFELTFEEWDACAEIGGCPKDEERANSQGLDRVRQAAFNLSWKDATTYVAWLSRMTGKQYRLLTEAEWEYAARAGSQEAYSWGAEVKKDGKAMANCNGCGSKYDNKRPAPVGEFAANGFGLHDMHGNVWEWVEDCYVDTLAGVPSNGAARLLADCKARVVRGGSWSVGPQDARSATRLRITPTVRGNNLGFRVARTLTP